MVPRRKMMNLGVLGSGYVGLTTAICLASIGHKMQIFDIDQEKIKNINQKKLPFFEKDLDNELVKVIENSQLQTVSSINELIEKTDGCFICVGTPSLQDKSIDLSQVKQAVKNIIDKIEETKKKSYTIIIRSTIIPLTTQKEILPIIEKTISSLDLRLAIVPEFLREGQAFSDFMNPDKIVIGGLNEKSNEFVKEIFNFFKENVEIILTNPQTAEMIKYANNAFFSTLISFSNEIANISEKVNGVDAFKVMNALISDKRITIKKDKKKFVPDLVTYLIPGCGFGGSCFPKDVNAITRFASKQGENTPLLDAVLEINAKRPSKIVTLVQKLLGDIKNKRISVIGLSFKPDTDDMRSSPSIEIIKSLKEMGASLSAFDPEISKEKFDVNGIEGVQIHSNLEDCLKNSELVILLTKWNDFKNIDQKVLEKNMVIPKIIDGRGFLDSRNFNEGTYYKIGFSIDNK
jgi:UDPglucose 6-dehydrogenase